MEWIPLDETLLAEAFNEAEAQTLTRARQVPSTDPVPGICAGLAARIRAAVLACGRVRLAGSERHIPQALRLEAVAILRAKLLVRFALAMTEERKREAEAAEARLDAIAQGEIPFAADIASTTPTYHGRPHHWQSPASGGLQGIH